jgi:hypothetical protein
VALTESHRRTPASVPLRLGSASALSSGVGARASFPTSAPNLEHRDALAGVDKHRALHKAFTLEEAQEGCRLRRPFDKLRTGFGRFPEKAVLRQAQDGLGAGSQIGEGAFCLVILDGGSVS